MPHPAIRIDHIAITVQDLERSVAFYRDLLGCEVLGQLFLDEGTLKLVFLRSGSACLELFEYRGHDAVTAVDVEHTLGGYKHLAFQTDDVDGLAAKLEAAGVVFTLEPTDATGGVRLAFFRDPDGNELEIVSGLPELAAYAPGWA
jgi:catechol 2,3-dioxygenase-like lactoylglutathione lyase family enzyme